MRRLTISLREFYSKHLGEMGRGGYVVVMCLVAREADSPEIFDEVERYWYSLHDLTGHRILFVFAGDNSIDTNRIEELEYIDYIFEVTNLTRSWPSHEPPWLRTRHSLEITDLRDFLNLHESEIPCLHITFLQSLNQITLKLPINRRFSIYNLIKSLCSSWHDTFLRIQASRIKISALEREIVAFEKKKQNFEKERNALSSSLYDLKDIGGNTESELRLLFSLTSVGEEKKSIDRKLCYSLLKKIGVKFSRKKVRSKLQKLIDQAHAMQINFNETNTHRIRQEELQKKLYSLDNHLISRTEVICQQIECESDSQNFNLKSTTNPSFIADSIYNSRRFPQTDFLIVTALEEETKAVMEAFDGWKRLQPENENTLISYWTEFSFYPYLLTYRLVLVPLLGMGRARAATTTTSAIHRWAPRFVVLNGIAGGIKEMGVALGDVLISKQIVDYEIQKITDKGNQIRWEVYQADHRLVGEAINLQTRQWKEIKGRPIPGEPKQHIGPIASGDKVIARKNGLEQYTSVWPQLIGVEMEAGGVASAVNSAGNSPGFLMIKGVSDLADSNKNSVSTLEWRQYACKVAAAYLCDFIKSQPVPISTWEED